MIYICADDFALSKETDSHILECINKGAINRISIFANRVNENIQIPEGVHTGAHINLVEGRAVSAYDEVSELTDKDGFFKYSFSGLLVRSLLPGREKLRKQIYTEIKNQINLFRKNIAGGKKFGIDTHQHTHMIPMVFKVIMEVLDKEKSDIEYIRIPAEPILPFLKTPSLYFTYSPVNIIKQWLLKFLWLFVKKELKKSGLKSALFMGILFSGNMDAERVGAVLPHFIRLAEKMETDAEILFHPGFTESGNSNEKFADFYLSYGRKKEYNAVMNLII